MKNTFGSAVTVTLFGESHGQAVGAVLDGVPSGITVDEGYIAKQLDARRPSGDISTRRVEADRFKIVSGVYNGKTQGTPICIIIPNEEADSGSYSALGSVARPGHADYTSFVRYHGFANKRGGGHFSGRLTAALTAAGAIVRYALEEKGIYIGTHVLECAGVRDRGFDPVDPKLPVSFADIGFPVLDAEAGEKMKAEIRRAASEGDSVGGILETAVTGLPAGTGEPWFDTVEGMLSHALFSVPAIKGVEFGAGFGLASMRGSAANDALRSENGVIRTVTNNNGGVNGGLTNGMPVIFRCAVKPTPSVSKEQLSVNLESGENVSLSVRGRHDPAIVHRAAAAVNAVTAIAVYDLLVSRFGREASDSCTEI